MSNKKCYGAITVSYIFEIRNVGMAFAIDTVASSPTAERDSASVCLPIPSGLGFSEFGGDAFRYTLL